jgi:hypothetical protein
MVARKAALHYGRMQDQDNEEARSGYITAVKLLHVVIFFKHLNLTQKI